MDGPWFGMVIVLPAVLTAPDSLVVADDVVVYPCSVEQLVKTTAARAIAANENICFIRRTNLDLVQWKVNPYRLVKNRSGNESSNRDSFRSDP
ncbi:MAG TPA: hypothetical protein VGH08_04470 [Chthoniobacterales bacterium]|jgi:hypothetical protein